MSAPHLSWLVKCSCGAQATGEADEYPQAWTAIDAWKVAHIDAKHHDRGRRLIDYHWVEDITVIGDRSRYDGINYIEQSVGGGS